jgi:diguanylate cyclase (GGDEF)-like protein
MKREVWHPNVRMSGCSVLLHVPDAEWRMRQGFPVEIVEARTDSLASLGEWLQASGYQPERRHIGDLGRQAGGARVRLVEVAAGESATRLAALTRRGPGEHVAIAAIVDEGDEASLSKALAVGPDDLLTYPFDEDELKTRLDALQQLGRSRAVLAERAQTFRHFLPTTPKAGAATSAQAPVAGRQGEVKGGRAAAAGNGRRSLDVGRPRVLVVGPASQHKVKVGEALARAAINYADSLEKAKGPLETGGFDLVVLLGTNAAARRDLVRWPEFANGGIPATLLVLDRASADDRLELRQRLAQLPVADRLTLPQPAELVRARMDFWLAFVHRQRQLLSPPADPLHGLCHDGLTGLFSHGYFLEHVRHLEIREPHRRAIVVIELVNLPRLNESAGYAAVNRYLATLGPTLRRNVRAEDLASHLGSGRFAVLLDDVAPLAATRIGRRLEQLLAKLPEAAAQLPSGCAVTPRLTARTLELDSKRPPLQQLQELLRWQRPMDNAAAA